MKYKINRLADDSKIEQFEGELFCCNGYQYILGRAGYIFFKAIEVQTGYEAHSLEVDDSFRLLDEEGIEKMKKEIVQLHKELSNEEIDSRIQKIKEYLESIGIEYPLNKRIG